MSIIKIATMRPLLEMFLADGFRATLDSDTVIQIKIDGGIYIVGCDWTDPGFYQIAYPSLWKGLDAGKDVKVVAACDAASRESKFAKCYTFDDSVHCTVHVMADGHAEFYKHFQRYLSALKYCTKAFYTALGV